MREMVHFHQQARKKPHSTWFHDGSVGSFHGSAAEIRDDLFVCCGCLVAEDIGVHQIERLVELLSLKECEDLLLTLSHPEESIFQHLERLSPEKNRLNIKKRVKRDTIANVDNVG